MNRILNFRPEALALLEVLLQALYTSNALGAYHEVQVGGTFGGIWDALLKGIWCEIRATDSGLTPDEVTAIAKVLREEALSNGEDLAYQIDLWNKGTIGLP